MISQNDPFDTSVNDLRQLLVKAKLIQNQTSLKGVVDATSLNELKTICDEGADLVELMREMLDVIEKRGGRVHGTVFSANEIVRRQNTFNELQNSYHDIRQFYQSVVPRVHAARPTEDGVQAVDEFAQVQEHAQREETALQDEILDRLTYGLRELRETGVTINDELETQDDMLNDIDKDMTTLQIKLRSANEKIDKLLASMSNGGKICTIVGLMVGIIVLLSLIF